MNGHLGELGPTSPRALGAAAGLLSAEPIRFPVPLAHPL